MCKVKIVKVPETDIYPGGRAVGVWCRGRGGTPGLQAGTSRQQRHEANHRTLRQNIMGSLKTASMQISSWPLPAVCTRTESKGLTQPQSCVVKELIGGDGTAGYRP